MNRHANQPLVVEYQRRLRRRAAPRVARDRIRAGAAARVRAQSRRTLAPCGS